MLFTKKLETMIKADLPIMEALMLARRQATKPGLISLMLTFGKSILSASAKFINADLDGP